jgi:hypothetical protein
LRHGRNKNSLEDLVLHYLKATDTTIKGIAISVLMYVLNTDFIDDVIRFSKEFFEEFELANNCSNQTVRNGIILLCNSKVLLKRVDYTFRLNEEIKQFKNANTLIIEYKWEKN